MVWTEIGRPEPARPCELLLVAELNIVVEQGDREPIRLQTTSTARKRNRIVAIAIGDSERLTRLSLSFRFCFRVSSNSMANKLTTATEGACPLQEVFYTTENAGNEFGYEPVAQAKTPQINGHFNKVLQIEILVLRYDA